jgi:hypothetical protein
MINLHNTILMVTATTLFALLSTPVQAEIIDNNTYTTDTESGLDWYDSEYTRGLSYYEVNDLFSTDLDGWRYATRSEANTLVANTTGMSVLANTRNTVASENVANYTDLLESIGYTWTAENTLFAMTGDAASASSHYYLTFRNNADYNDYLNNDANTREDDFAMDWKASLLVRNSTLIGDDEGDSKINATPIPGALLMFLPGLLGLWGYNNRRKSNPLKFKS